MDDPLTKWLHLHSNINNTAGTVSAEKRISPFQPTFKRANLNPASKNVRERRAMRFAPFWFYAIGLWQRMRGLLKNSHEFKCVFMADLLLDCNIISRRFFFIIPTVPNKLAMWQTFSRNQFCGLCDFSKDRIQIKIYGCAMCSERLNVREWWMGFALMALKRKNSRPQMVVLVPLSAFYMRCGILEWAFLIQ